MTDILDRLIEVSCGCGGDYMCPRCESIHEITRLREEVARLKGESNVEQETKAPGAQPTATKRAKDSGEELNVPPRASGAPRPCGPERRMNRGVELPLRPWREGEDDGGSARDVFLSRDVTALECEVLRLHAAPHPSLDAVLEEIAVELDGHVNASKHIEARLAYGTASGIVRSRKGR